MILDRRKTMKLGLIGALVLALGPWASSADAQYFGRNKVQYNAFEFRVLQTEHFDIYYYEEEREAIELLAKMAERWYERLSRLLNHEFDGRQPLIMYASHPDFEQTTAIGGTLDEATGGVTEALKRRMVLPFAGPLEDTDHVLGHELVHAFQFDITSRGSSALGGSFPTALALPLWFIEGMAEYLSVGPVDPHTAMWMRDAALSESFPTLKQLANPRKYFPYRYGQAFWAYVAGRWGDQAVGEVLKAAGRAVDPYFALEQVLQIPIDSLSAQWRQANIDAFESVAKETSGPDEYGSTLIGCCKGSGRLNIAPVLSPDGKQVAFLSEKDLFSIELFLADAETGEIKKKILKTAVDPHFESLQYIKSAGTWHPEGHEFAFGAVSKGTAIVSIIDVERGGRDRDYKIRQVGEIFNPSWSPDGRYIAFSAIHGGLSDLFMLDVETGEVTQLTDDPFAALQPTWSPDGTRIAFVTDRFSSDLATLSMGNYRLAFLDPATGAIEQVRSFSDGKHINPQWSADGNSLYFLSDANGITNIFRVDLRTSEIFQLTNLLVGVSGITALSPALSVDGPDDRMIYSAYSENTYSLHTIDNPSELGQEELTTIARITPAVLPPADRPVGDVMAMIDNATLGLPDTIDEFEDKKYKPGLSLDYIAPPTLVVGSDRFGTFVGGGTALFFSDILGRRNLSTLLQVNGGVKDIAAVVGYENRRSRWNWAVVGGQIPIVTLGLGATVVEGPDGQPVLIEETIRFRQINRELTGVLAYPFSRVHRVEFSGRFRRIDFDSSVETIATSFSGVIIDEDDRDLPSCSDVDQSTTLCDPESLTLGTATSALVYDNSFFGGTGPILGQRYRLEAAPTFGTLNFAGTLADYRRYIMPAFPYTFAARLIHFGRYGPDAEDNRLQPLFLGYQQVIRGYNSGSFSTAECRPGAFDSDSFALENEDGVLLSTCPQFDQLLGSRMLVGNFELRFPLFRGIGLRRPPGFPPLTLAFFFDAGVAWWSESQALRVGGNKDPFSPISSYGATMRLNLFGAAILELDFVHPNNRPDQGWYFQFGFNPGY